MQHGQRGARGAGVGGGGVGRAARGRQLGEQGRVLGAPAGRGGRRVARGGLRAARQRRAPLLQAVALAAYLRRPNRVCSGFMGRTAWVSPCTKDMPRPKPGFC